MNPDMVKMNRVYEAIADILPSDWRGKGDHVFTVKISTDQNGTPVFKSQGPTPIAEQEHLSAL